MVDTIEAVAGPAWLVLAPDLGGGIARLDVGGRPVLRPFAGDAAHPFTLACNVLAPFSNRISGGGLRAGGTFHPVAPNLPGEEFPIHGDAFQRRWQVAEGAAGAPTLDLPDGRIGPWRYRARQRFHLTPDALTVTLTLTNTGEAALPFGGGFHPWFPRDADTRLAFDAQAVWMEDGRHLPAGRLALSDAPAWGFAHSRPLPEGWINNAYDGWTGRARIRQGAGAVSCTVAASGGLDHSVVFSPGAGAGFFCFEPVSHPVDAVNLPGCPGLRLLDPGAALSLSMTLDWAAD